MAPSNTPDESESDAVQSFFESLISAQPRMYAFAVTLLSDLDAAQDVLQATNCALIQKSAKFDPSRDFLSWACGFVRLQAREHYRDLGRDKHQFSFELIEQIASEEACDLSDSPHRGALRVCLESLTEHQRMLIELRYAPGASVAMMVEQLNRPAASISTSLSKIRRSLADCVRRVVPTE